MDKYGTHDAQLQEEFDSLASMASKQASEPSRELLRATLGKIDSPVPSFIIFSPARKVGIAALAVIMLLIGGGTLLHGGLSASMGGGSGALSMNNSDVSDAALASDAAAIDGQLSALDDDTAQADEGLSRQ